MDPKHSVTMNKMYPQWRGWTYYEYRLAIEIEYLNMDKSWFLPFINTIAIY